MLTTGRRARVRVCLSFDVDAASFWLTTIRTSSPSEISRGEFGPLVAVPRLLALLERRGIPATFFVPAMTARQFPETVFAIAAGGHEVAAHGDLHERLVGLDSFEEAAVLDRSFTTLAGITGTPPRGFRAPGWELSLNTIGLLEDRGVGYDSSMFASDFHPYRPRRDDTIAEGEWTRGPLSRLWEIPVSWELDDFPAFFLRPPSFTMGRDPDAVFATWRDEFDYASRYEQDGVFTLTMHPMVIGRGPRLMMLERLLDHMSADGATFVRMHQIADACERGER